MPLMAPGVASPSNDVARLTKSSRRPSGRAVAMNDCLSFVVWHERPGGTSRSETEEHEDEGGRR